MYYYCMKLGASRQTCKKDNPDMIGEVRYEALNIGKETIRFILKEICAKFEAC